MYKSKRFTEQSFVCNKSISYWCAAVYTSSTAALRCASFPCAWRKSSLWALLHAAICVHSVSSESYIDMIISALLKYSVRNMLVTDAQRSPVQEQVV